ncbi:MAG: Type 1 glutamine amidotransferase-like domain-containing protein [Balneolales bacterium]|nr:Type 1 glutamine amidotransferase-like domain-containing protein [Balneolales bacterium]
MIQKLPFSILLFLLVTSAPISLLAQGHLMLAGGGSESSASSSWSAEPYAWFVEKANEQPIIVLSQSDNSTWIPNYFTNLGAAEVINMTIQGNTEAEIAEALLGAGGVFMKGGNQQNYISAWKGTLVEERIRAVFEAGGVVGGTSAGAMVAGEFVTPGGSTSDQNLRNPFNASNIVETDFLGLLPFTIVDTHYFERGRPGRLLGMMSRIYTDFGATQIRGIGIDDKTAVLIYPDLTMRVSGTGGVHVFRTMPETIIEAEPNQDLHIRNMKTHQLTHGFVIDLNTGILGESPVNATEVAAYEIPGFAPSVFMRRNGWTAAYLQDKSEDQSRIVLDGGEFPVTAIMNDDVPAEIISWSPGLVEQEEWLESLFAADRLFINLHPSDWLLLSSSAYFNELLQSSNTETELLMRHLPVSGDGFATNLTAGEFIAYDGRIRSEEGSSFFPGIVVVDSTYLNQNQFENRASAPGWLMHVYESHLSLSGTRLTELSVQNGELRIDNQLMPALLLDAREGYITGRSPFVASGSSNQTRNSAAVSHGWMHVLPEGSTFQLYEPVSVSVEPPHSTPVAEIPDGPFRISRIFPNPFNPSTTLTVQAEKPSEVSIQVFNMLGQQVFEIPAARLHEGENQFRIHLESNSTGIYLIRVSSGSHVQTTRATLVK